MHNHAPANYNCPFCLLVQGIENQHVLSVRTDVVHTTHLVTALVSSHQWPNNPGNVIVVPNQHFENIYDLPIDLALPIHELVKAIALAMKTVYSCDGVSTRQHNEPAGNQDVWHYHVHVTPRYKDDGLYASRRQIMPSGERANHAQRLRAYLVEQARRL